MDKIAVLMSTYNGEKYVQEQIDSILEQKGDFQLDLYVRDDGSNDKTIDILRRYEMKKKIVWYTGGNLKPAKSFMDLLKRSGEYEYYAFADQDDVWNDDKIQKGIKCLKGIDEPALYCSNAELVGENLESFGRNVYKNEPRTDFETVICAGGLLGCTMIFNAPLANAIKNYTEDCVMVLHDFYIAAVCVSIGGRIIYDSETTMKYRQHEKNVVGVSHGLIGTLKGRIMDILYKEPISIADQSEHILYAYMNELDKDKENWLETVAHYKENKLNRLKLACSHRTKYINKNMSLKLRLSILLGNR